MPDPQPPVFYDPRQQRWRHVKRLALLMGLPVLAILAALLVIIAQRVELPRLALPNPLRPPPALEGVTPLPPPPPTHGLSVRMQGIEEQQHRLARLKELRRRSQRDPGIPEMPTGLRCAFLAPDDDQGEKALAAHGAELDLVMPLWLHCHDEDASLDEERDDLIAQDRRRLAAAKIRRGIMPVVDNCRKGRWDGAAMAMAWNQTGTRTRLCTALVAFAQRMEAVGLCVDMQDLAGDLPSRSPHIKGKTAPRSRYETYLLFLQDLARSLHRERLQLAVCVPFDDAGFPYRSVAAHADLVLATAFDRSPGNRPAALAPQPWFETALARRLADVGANRLVTILGNHACDWTLGGREEPVPLACEDALDLARDHAGTWSWSASALNPSFTYRDDHQRTHRVWMLDAATAFNQMAALERTSGAGLGWWRLGAEDPSAWRLWSRDQCLDQAMADTLNTVGLDAPVATVGDGEILRVTATLTPGERNLHYDAARQRITDETWHAYPTPCTITRWGSRPKQVVFTFDDGPDPAWTPAILDILRAKEVPATFFIVGAQAERHPDLLARMVREGHEVGNHTFTHPNVLRLSLGQVELELNATQRLIEARTGRQTLLYRAPMGVDAEPRTMEEARSLEAVNALGYVCVGMRLDTDDWRGLDADSIVQRTLAMADRDVGNVVLMHDSGGDRSATVAALPRLIYGFRQRGWECTTIAGLLDTSRDAVMPRVRTGIATLLGQAGFSLVHVALRLLEWLFLLGVVLGSVRLALIAIAAVIEHRRAHRHHHRKGYLPRVAVIVPAYNEEKVVVQTVRSLLASDYKGSLEIVVVDDGSKDLTHRVTKEAFEGRSRIRALTKANGGKALALNFGIAETTADVLVAMDADTVFRADTIRLLVRHFGDPRVGAVAGNAKVGNRINLMTRWQALEYITCQNLDRRAFALVNAITVVPGAVGAWRREAVLKAGGFTHATLAEDADLTMAILRQGYVVRNEPDAVALTEAPDTVHGFIKQRYRWMFGTIQAAFRHRGALVEFRPLGLIALPNVFIFGVLFPLISPVMDLMLVLALASWGWDAWYRGTQAAMSWNVLGWYLAFVAVDHAAAWLAFRLEPGEERRLMWWLFLQRFFYRQLMYYVAIKSFLAVLKGQAVGWGKLERKATVAQPAR